MSRSARGRRARVRRGAAVALALVPLGLAACGDDDAENDAAPAAAPAASLEITTSDDGTKGFRTVATETVKGGLVELTFKNAGQDPHEAQLVRIEGDHTTEEALAAYAAEEGATPDWLRFAGGAGTTGPGQTVTSALNLEPGRYAMLDDADFMGPVNSERGALASFEVTDGSPRELPESTATVAGIDNDSGPPDHEFEASGLKVGENRLRFENKGTEPHHVILFPILPGRSLDDVEKFFATERPSGPPPVDFAKAAGTAVLDGETTEVTDLQLRKAGPYALVCFITDRDGKGKPHLLRGMIKEVDVG